MPELKWNAALEIGHQVIDQQHRTLVGLVNQLQEAAGQLQAHDTLEEIFNELESYTLYHFTQEEHIMREIGFPLYEAHVEEHQQMRRQVAQFHGSFSDGEEDLGEVISYLTKWLINHICHSDALIGDTIRQS